MTTRTSRLATKCLSLAAALALVAAGAGAAHADDISNSLDTTIDSTAEVLAMNVDGPVGATTLYVQARNGDGKNGCNLSSGQLVLDLASSNTAVATVSPSRVTFANGCGSVGLSVTPVGVGSASITATQVSNTTGGSFNLAPATFSVTVAPPANSAPVVTVSGVTAGTAYAKGSVPAATCLVTDDEDGPSTFPATLSAITGPDSADGLGEQTASCSYTDAGGLTASADESYTIYDASAPVITYTLSPALPDGANGWYRGNVDLVWHVSEPQSPVSLQTTGCDDMTFSTDAVTEATCSASSAGGTAGPVSVTVHRDGTAPVVTGLVSSTPVDVAGTLWYADSATVDFTATDNLSGVDSGPTPPSVTLGAGVGLSASSSATDTAGNTGTATVSGLNVDAAAPVVSLTCPAGDVVKGSAASASWRAADEAAGSGLATAASGNVALATGAVGTFTATAPVAVDNVGHTSAAATCSYRVVFAFTGFYQPIDGNGVLNVVKAGSAVPVKFSLGGDQGMAVLQTGYPKISPVACTAGAVSDAIEELSTATTSGLKYDPLSGQYNYTWKTTSGLTGTCQQLTVKLVDGTTHTALFKFTK